MYIVCLVGELDLAGAEAVEAALRQAEASDASLIVLDLDRLDFIDSMGLATLVRAQRRADVDNNRLRVTRGSGPVADVLRLSALDQTLRFL